MKKEIIEIDGLSVQFYLSGNQASEKGVLFIHGFALSGMFFRKQLESDLLSQYRIVSFDLPGCGNTPLHEQKHSLRYLVEFIPKVIREIGLYECVLVGHSLGGHIGIASLELCENISGLFTFGTPPLRSLEDFERAFVPSVLSMIYQETLIKDEIYLIAEQICVTDYNRKEIANMIGLSSGSARKMVFDSFVNHNVNEVEVLKRHEDLPVFLWHSLSDSHISFEYLNSINKLLPDSCQVQFIENDSHSPSIDYPDLFNKYLSDFLRKVFI